MNEFQQKRHDKILSDMLQGLAFFDYDGNMWLFDLDTEYEDYIYNQYGKRITMGEFDKILTEYVTV